MPDDDEAVFTLAMGKDGVGCLLATMGMILFWLLALAIGFGIFYLKLRQLA